MLIRSYQCHSHNPIISSIRCSANAPGHETHDNRTNTNRISYDVCYGDGSPLAVVDVDQLILGFLRRKAVVNGPIDCLRRHIDNVQSLNPCRDVQLRVG